MTIQWRPTRREALLGAFGASVLDASAKASQPATPVNFEIPANACDCHTHIIGDPEKFHFWPGRTYTPEPALPVEMAALHRALHIDRVVIVTPSVYGTDNSATIYGMLARQPNARGVAVIDEKTSAKELAAMNEAGIRGIRLNLATAGVTDPAIGRRKFQAIGGLVRLPGWHIQINTDLGVLSAIKELILSSPAPVVIDHFGGLLAKLGMKQRGFADLVDVVRSGKAYVKISGAYRSSTLGPDYADMVPFARALIEANADRVVWGTDWPHPDVTRTPGRKPTDLAPLLPIDDGRLLNQLAIWAPDPAVRQKILVDNPAQLYGF